MAEEQEVVTAWRKLPRRIYLDTSTLQTIYDYGEVIWENEPLMKSGRAAKVSGLADEVLALRNIFQINERAQFGFAVSAASLNEVAAKGSRCYTQWVHDVLDTWLVQTRTEAEPERTSTFIERRFGNISIQDRRLLQDALDLQCDAFLTMERRLPTAADFVERTTGLRILRPTTYWRLLARWAGLYR